ncbi:MAG: Glu/Leu/Phe/Val dehydrogenase, partial [Alphaproteobacteria bacterium]
PGVTAAPADAIVDVDCDIWIPAARPDVVTMANVDRLKAKLVLQGANIPMSVEAEESLHARGVIVVPDFIANAGGVICAAVEYRGGGESQALQAIVDKVGANTRDVLERAARDSATPRAAALAMARERVLHAMAWRR